MNNSNSHNSSDCSVRTFVEPVYPVQNNGIIVQYLIEEAAWIWHPELDRITEAFVCFKIEFEGMSSDRTKGRTIEVFSFATTAFGIDFWTFTWAGILIGVGCKNSSGE